MSTSLPAAWIEAAVAPLAAAERARPAAALPAQRQPVHTVYGGAHLFRADTATKLGAVALRALDELGADEAELASVLGYDATSAIRERVEGKLRREPVEDLRIDFEDGYGVRPWAEEDGHAASAAKEVALGLSGGTLPPFLGIRIKPLGPETRARALRTLDVFVTTLAGETGGRLPAGFVVTLPKITLREEVAFLAEVLGELEARLALPGRSLSLELMIETTESLLGPSGDSALPGLFASAAGRCVAAHFGAYDYTASCEITAAHQSLSHPACDFARHAMQLAYARTGIRLSDGATNVLPIGPHRPATSDAQRDENRRVIRRAARLHFDNIQRALAQGFYQGWDLHPAQLPVRYAATYAFFLAGLAPAAERLRSFVARAAQASRVGEVFDDAATGQGLLNFFLRAVGSGALTADEAARASGLTLEQLAGRSFAAIVARP